MRLAPPLLAGVLVLAAPVLPAAATESVSLTSPSALSPLSLDEVVESAAQHFPLLQAALLERNARENQLVQAQGAFDLRLGLSGDLRPAGFYENYAGDAQIEQPTQLWGASFYGGYRYGAGDFASYDGGRLTDSAGEVRLGFDVPLLRGGAIDAQRATLRGAEIGLESIRPELRLERVRVLREASVAFWAWVAAGRTVTIAESLLSVAEARQSQIAGRVERGGEPEINLADNGRLVVERRALLRGAQRDFQQSAIRLSLFLRDDGGNPVRVAPERLPPVFPDEEPPDRRAVEDDLEFARTRHPLLEQLAFQRERLEVDAELAENELLPDVGLRLEGSRDFGSSREGIDEQGKLSSSPRGDTEVKALLRFELPVQRRAAKGKAGLARIRLAQLQRRERFTRDRVVADALVAFEALEAAFEQTAQARENLRLAKKLRSGEQRKLELGLSNLIDVNIREVQEATAARQLVDAQNAYFRALADYQARIARTS